MILELTDDETRAKMVFPTHDLSWKQFLSLSPTLLLLGTLLAVLLVWQRKRTREAAGNDACVVFTATKTVPVLVAANFT